MYQLESAKVKPINQNGYWLDEDVSTKLIREIFQDYKKAIFYLSNTFFPLNVIVYLDMEAIRVSPLLVDDEITLGQWFIDIGNAALLTSPTPPDLSPKLVKYGDAWKANYSIRTIPTGQDVDRPAIESEKTDLYLERGETDFYQMGRRCLASVNGFLHYTEGRDNGYIIKDGGKSAKYCNKTQIGLLSFNDICDLELIPLNRDMIRQTDVPLKEKVYLDTGVDLVNKTILVSIGGYLHILNEDVYSGIQPINPEPVTVNVYGNNVWLPSINIPYDVNKPILVGQNVSGAFIKPYTTVMEIVMSGDNIQSIRLNNAPTATGSTTLTFTNDLSQRSIVDVVSGSTIVINWFKFNYAHRYFEQRRFMDMGSLGLSTSVNNPSRISVEEFYSDETIKRYLEMSQSFLIVLDSEQLVDFFVDYKMLEGSKLPGVYCHHEEPLYPMQIGLGRLGNYWKTYDDGRWILDVEDSYYRYYGFETTQYLMESSIDGGLVPNKPIDYADAYLMVMGVD